MNTFGEIIALREKQDSFFSTGKTKDIKWRKESLKRLRNSIIAHDREISEALHADLNKSSFEAYATETGIVLHDLRIQINNLPVWSKPERVSTPLFAFPCRSSIVCEPYGKVFIISPWNYPFQLALVPLAGAIAAGNVVTIRPSRSSINTNRIIKTIIEECFSTGHVAVVDCDVNTTEAVLNLRWDLVFFTGSTGVGRGVYKQAAGNLTPAILELGGKSPAIVDEDANIRIAARRIIWGKLINAGQTCIAPDYLFVNKKVREQLITALKEQISTMYGEMPVENPEYPKVITIAAFERIVDHIRNGKVIYGGKSNKETLSIEPTLLDSSVTDHIMQDEIFGPVLPVIAFEDLEEVIGYINSKEKPLALYYFSGNRKNQEKVIRETSSGACFINDVVLHIANSSLPYGGVGASGIGRYHGRESFNTFSNRKSVMKAGTIIDLPFRYPPFANKEWLIRKVLR